MYMHHMCVYTYIYVYMCVCIYIYICIRTYCTCAWHEHRVEADDPQTGDKQCARLR